MYEIEGVSNKALGGVYTFRINNTFYLLSPPYYVPFYNNYLRIYLQIYDGYVPTWHNLAKGLTPNRLAQSVNKGLFNILFAHGTLLQVQRFVYDNANLPFLRFYYAKETIGREIVRRPLIVPERQMESLRIICAVDDGNIAIVPQSDSHFAKGQQVRITQGRFAGVTGRVARYQGQQRVAVVIDGLITIATAYIPTAFLAPIND